MSVIPGSFRRAYDNTLSIFEYQKKLAEPLLIEIAKKFKGAYEGRIKSPDSTLSKIELTDDKLKSFIDMNDFFAAAIAVPSLNSFPDIQAAVRSTFIVHLEKMDWEMKPREFLYDDFHMILSIKDSAYIRDKNVLDVKFELQIKTMLQLQWWHLEHDIIYKANRRSWEKSRLFGQMRAMFELADRLLANIDEVAKIQQNGTYADYEIINEMAEFLETIWPDKLNPPWYDLVRTSETVIKLMGMAEYNMQQLKVLMQDPNNASLSTIARTLTPPQVILIALFRHVPSRMLQNLGETKLLITEEMYDFEPSLRNIPSNNKFIL